MNFNWEQFSLIAIITLSLWTVGAITLYLSKRKMISTLFILAGVTLFSLFIAALWIGKGHPPMRTMGETRLWYSLFLVIVGFLIYNHWGYRWIMLYSLLLSSLFIVINIVKPDLQSSNLMPALQSPWFVPHVTLYMLSYALLGAATIASIIALIEVKKGREVRVMPLIDNVTYIGIALLMVGLLMGALWAKEAWGDFWSWDPKETWALITAAVYLIYLHARLFNYNVKVILWLLPIAFLLLMITWLGVSYLPAAKGSIHLYQ